MKGAEWARIAAGLIFFIAGLLWLLGAFAFAFLRYGLPPCESDEPILWALLAFAASLFAGTGIMAARRLKAATRIALAVGIPAAMFGVQYLVFADNDVRQTACAARSLPEAMAACGGVASHYRSGTSDRGYATLTLVAPGTSDRAWNCLHSWTLHAKAPPSLLVDESVYTAYRAAGKTAGAAPAP